MRSSKEIQDNRRISVIKLCRMNGTVLCSIPGESEKMLVDITKCHNTEYISASYKDRYPTIDELMFIRHIFFRSDEKVTITFPDTKNKKRPYSIRMRMLHNEKR